MNVDIIGAALTMLLSYVCLVLIIGISRFLPFAWAMDIVGRILA